MKQSSSAVAVLALLAAAAAVVAAADPVPPPGYTKREDVYSDFIKQVSRFAVTVYKLAHGVPFTYVRTLQCWSAPAGGGANNYWVLLTATNGTGAAAGKYVTRVWGIPGSQSNTWKLLSFFGTN